VVFTDWLELCRPEGIAASDPRSSWRGDLERQIDAFEHYNHVRYHESINNLTPADVYFGRAETILAERQRIKRATIARLQHQLQLA
jgi:putative transposase